MGCNLSRFKMAAEAISERLDLPISLAYERGADNFRMRLLWDGVKTRQSAVFFSKRHRARCLDNVGNNPRKGWAWDILEDYPRRYDADDPPDPREWRVSTTESATEAAAIMINTYVTLHIKDIANSIFPNCHDDIPF